MKRRKALSLLLILTILLSLVVPATSALADDDTSVGDGDKTKGMNISKTASYNENTKDYTITLEAFATGEEITSVISTEVPTDVILVLDQSSSMGDNKMGGYEYTAYKVSVDWWNSRNYNNDEYYPLRHNGGSENLWYELDKDRGEYVSVSVEQEPKYDPISGRSNSWYYSNASNLFCLISGEYKPVTVNRTGDWYSGYAYNYTVDGQTILSSNGYNTTPDFGEYGSLYQATKNYIYSYTLNDVKTIIEESQGDETTPNTQLYKRGNYSDSAGPTRLEALKAAVTNFANAVNVKAKGPDGEYGTKDDVSHRIAIVGFASGGIWNYNNQNYNYENTEVFVGSSQYTYGSNAQAQYKNAFQDMSTVKGAKNISASIGALSANGGTLTSLGLEMANGIFAANPIGSDEQRNRVIIVFTDGAPGWSGYEKDIAQTALDNAASAKKPVKDGGYGATVYTVGVFPGADANDAGSLNTNNDADKGNYFLQLLSSNTKYPQSPSYYLSAADSGTLNNIFQQISDNLPSGGSSTTLDGNTVVKDIISPYFTLPKGANKDSIRLTTYDCTAKTGDTYTWGNPQDAKTSGVTADVNGDQVSVTGFNFSENWCGLDKAANGNETPHGKKLVISFEVERKSGFLGGYSVDTNGGAYIYENADAKEPLMEFEKPKVDVTIPDVGVTAEDKNVYLLGEVTLDQLKSGAVVKADDGSENGIPIDLSKANDPDKPYGLEQWQTQYVDITVAVKDKDGKDVTDKIGNLTDDTTYKIIVTVSPKQGTVASGIGPEVTAKSGDATGNIYVFKPELTFVDSVAYYGEAVPTDNDYSANKVGSDVWKHKGVEAVPGQMIGEKPTLKIKYTPDSTKIIDNKYTKQDVPVKATVKIGNEDVTGNTTFVHQPCNPDCGWTTPENPGDPAFLIHVKTCTLTITKTGEVQAKEPFVFTVYKDGNAYTEVTIVGAGSVTIAELPIGKYSIEEHTGWSWRYKDPTYANNGVELNATNPTGTITCTNTKGNDQWLNDYGVVSNIYGKSNTPATDGNN